MRQNYQDFLFKNKNPHFEFGRFCLKIKTLISNSRIRTLRGGGLKSNTPVVPVNPGDTGDEATQIFYFYFSHLKFKRNSKPEYPTILCNDTDQPEPQSIPLELIGMNY